MRDAVLEGPRPEEVDALVAIVTGKNDRPSLTVALRLRAKGWIEMVNGHYLVTIAGRALLDRATRQQPTPA
jgi:hypothetical protein